MRFRPCIDIHNGSVKQIVGGSLKDLGDYARENFVATQDASFYAGLYREHDIRGGHVILLNHADSPYYEKTRQQALDALRTFKGGLQAGGGIDPLNAEVFLDAGASHVIVTSYVFRNGVMDEKALERMIAAVGKDRLVLDLSCRVKDDEYFIVTDRWQKFTGVKVNKEIMTQLSEKCDEFLIHAADVEGKRAGVDERLINILSESPIPVTYAGGVHEYRDIDLINEKGKGRVDYTIGSALDIFGGDLEFSKIIKEYG